MTVSSLAFLFIIVLACERVAGLQRGSVVAIVTPMKSNGNVDYDKFSELLNWHKQQGSDGAVILGTTGEGSLVSFEERASIIRTAVSTVKGSFPVIVGTGSIESRKTIELTEQAKALGADASLIITPYYIKPPQRALINYFRTIADAVDLPLIAYNCPGRTGVDMKPETIAECATHPGIVGVKDATGDLSRVQTLRNLCGEKFLIYSGEDDSGREFVKLGGDGVISVTANVAPKQMHEMLKLARMGNDVEAKAIDDLLMPLHKRLFLESNPIPAKKALQMMKRIDGGIRPPLAELDPIHNFPLEEALRGAGLL